MFKITIVNMDTNKTVIDEESGCIIGAVKLKKGAQSIGLTCVNAIDITETIVSADKAKNELLKNEQVMLVYSLSKLLEKEKLD